MIPYSKKSVMGIPIVSATLFTIIPTITALLNVKGKKTISYVNAYCLQMASYDKEYKSILKKMTCVYSGGIGPIIASRILGNPLAQRTPTPDFIFDFLKIAQKKDWSIYLLGSRRSIVEKAAKEIKKNVPGLKIAGYHNGYFSRREEVKIIEDIDRKKPTILFVGMGSPRQEKWIAANKDSIDAQVFWAVGALFDILSGELPRAPLLFRKLGLEWLYRLFQEPKRLWKRYTIGNILFVLLVVWKLIKKGKKKYR